jgi:hypothetical protein
VTDGASAKPLPSAISSVLGKAGVFYADSYPLTHTTGRFAAVTEQVMASVSFFLFVGAVMTDFTEGKRLQ